ncbi:MAG: glycosyltransferase family 2 protein, partial [Verrucomicrobiales bacterium]|nr:glycosyltransferase family 2 protein [Verrucomicrobiales bacterium]
MNDKLPVSVVMIARNEERQLPRSLGSVAGWVREIIVVINDCTDNTAAAAGQFGAIVSEHPFKNLREQKQFALDQAGQPWVLGLDADEVVSDELRKELLVFFRQVKADVNGAWLPRRLWFMDKWVRHGDNYPDRVLRLFRREKTTAGGVEEHDRFDVEGRTVFLTHDLLHYSHKSIADHMAKINFFTDFFARRMIAKGHKCSPLSAILHSVWRFFRAYVLRRGFLDG